MSAARAAPGESDLVQTARIDPTFVWTDGVTTVGSEVDIFNTTAQAKRDWRLSTLAVVGRCLLESARKSLAKQHATVTIAAADSLAPPKLGERSLPYRPVSLLTPARAGPAACPPFLPAMSLPGRSRQHAALAPFLPANRVELDQVDLARALAVPEERALDALGAGHLRELGRGDRRAAVVVWVDGEDDALALAQAEDLPAGPRSTRKADREINRGPIYWVMYPGLPQVLRISPRPNSSGARSC